jgi:hypothetical protein
MLATFESKTELFIIYENFQGFVNLKEHTRTEFQQKCILSQVLIGLMEINSYGYSACYFDTNNLVEIGEFNYRLFDLNYLTKHGKGIRNVKISQELKIKAPEIDASSRAFRCTDVWGLGMFMLMIFQKKRMLNVSVRRLKQNFKREIQPLLQHKICKESISQLLLLMLREEYDSRIDLVAVF